MTKTTVSVLSHGYCFDGLVSATLFCRLLERIEPRREHDYTFRSCGYGPKLKTIPKSWLSASVNALLDFRYAESDALTFYFDHHKTAFASEQAERDALARVRAAGKRRALHYDPDCTSCAKLIARVGAETYGVPSDDVAELVEWADRVDSARLESPDEAFFARSPALVLADVVERHGDSAFYAKVAHALLRKGLEATATSADIRDLAAPLDAAKQAFMARVVARGELRGDVAVVDLGDELILPSGKFATYVAFPECRYSVILLRTKDQLKLGIGFNPWSGKERLHDVSEICRREGGGGHAVVGAVNYPHADIDRARDALSRVVATLAG